MPAGRDGKVSGGRRTSDLLSAFPRSAGSHIKTAISLRGFDHGAVRAAHIMPKPRTRRLLPAVYGLDTPERVGSEYWHRRHAQKQFIIPLPFEKSNTFLRGTPENVGAKIGKSASAGSLFRQKPIVSCVFPGSGMDRGGLRHISWVHRKPGGAGIPRSPAAGHTARIGKNDVCPSDGRHTWCTPSRSNEV